MCASDEKIMTGILSVCACYMIGHDAQYTNLIWKLKDGLFNYSRA